jgi:hypothetical protein
MIIIDPPSDVPSGPWVQFIIATPNGTFEWPPESYGWGSAVVKVKSKAAKDNQKAAGRSKAKTKKSGPAPLEVTIEMTFVRAKWNDPRGACAILNALDPNNPEGEGGPFDFMSADFNRRLGKSIDIDEVGEVVWRGDIGTCTITAKEWVPDPPKENKQGTTAPDKSTEHSPGDENGTGQTTTILARGGIVLDGRIDNTETQSRDLASGLVVKTVAIRGFDGPEAPKVGP